MRLPISIVAATLVATSAGAQGPADTTIRIATYNVSLNRAEAGALAQELSGEPSDQVRAVVAILRHVRPDVLVLNEFDLDETDAALGAFHRLLDDPAGDGEPLDLGFGFVAPVNTGVPSGLDLDADGAVGGPGDAWGYGAFPGQYGMAILSRLVIDYDDVRSFQELPWAEVPANQLPRAFYGAAADHLRLSSKSHWDVPIHVGRQGRIHLLVSHPTPPAFDGPEQRNQRRNADEIRFWHLYLDDGADAFPVDDQGRTGGLAADARFVILGDLNLDPADGNGRNDVVRALLAHPRVRDPQPKSTGPVAAAIAQGGANHAHVGEPALDTADFRDDPGPGNLRVDYALPSANLRLVGTGVFWPAPGEFGHDWVRDGRASDHHLVWVDVALE